MTKIKTVCVDKVAYEAVLRNSIRVNDLEAENQQLKELLKYCHYYIINTPVYPQGDDAKQMEIHKLSDQITNAIGEKK